MKPEDLNNIKLLILRSVVENTEVLIIKESNLMHTF